MLNKIYGFLKTVKMVRAIYFPFRDTVRRSWIVSKYIKDTKSSRKYVSSQYDEIISEKSINERSGVVYGAVEISRACNLNCPMCSTSLSVRSNEVMDLDLFEKIIGVLDHRGVHNICLHTIGEPLMNKKIKEYLKVIRGYKMRVSLITNALLVGKRFEDIKEFQDVIQYIGISIDGADKETYEKLRPPAKFENLLVNLEKLNELKVEKRIYSVASKATIDQLAFHLDFYSKYVPMEDIHISLLNSVSPDNQYFNNSTLFEKHIESKIPCSSVLDSHVIFQSNGNVTACSRDYSDDLVYGNIIEDDLDKIINNDNINRMQFRHLQNNIPGGHACSECFQTDERVQSLFTLFYKTLVYKNRNHWDVKSMQSKFDLFVREFSDNIPSKSRFLEIVYE